MLAPENMYQNHPIDKPKAELIAFGKDSHYDDKSERATRAVSSYALLILKVHKFSFPRAV